MSRRGVLASISLTGSNVARIAREDKDGDNEEPVVCEEDPEAPGPGDTEGNGEGETADGGAENGAEENSREDTEA